MRVGDLVRNPNSEGGLLGVIVGWHHNPVGLAHPVVYWNDGHTSWIMAHRVEILNANW
jgi:hypothetical protein